MKAGNSFTVRFSSRVTTLVTHVVVMPAFDPTCDTPPTKQVKLNAIWDTGASGTCITEQIAEELGLSHFRVVTTHTANGDRESKVYKVNLMLPNNAGFAMVNATECAQLTGNCDVLVGMDIIGMGDFAITEADENTIMSFRFPHVEAIDYTGKGLPKKAIPVYNAKVGRNDPCPCGSGLKYKKCHGKKS